MTALPHGDRFRRHAMKPSARTLLTLIVWLLLLLASAGELTAADFAWVNQREPPRPRYVWENREDVIYHDLSYSDKAVESAPEIAPFMGRIWVFNRAMQWHREPEGIVCYSAPATLMLTGADAVSTWHSDPANNITQDGQWTMFIKQSRIRRRDCAVLPAFQFHLEQNPLCELDVAEATDDWQFVVSVKGRGGPPLLTSDWQTGPAKIRFDLATALRRKGYDLNFAELHFVMGTWAKSAEASASIRFRLRLLGQPAVAACLPIVQTVHEAGRSGTPLLAVALDEHGDRLGKDHVRMRTLLAGRTIELAERDGFWRASVPNLGVGDYTARFLVEGSIKAAGTLPVRVTDGRFWKLNPQRRLFELGSQPEGPLSGSYQGNVFVRDAGRRSESLVQGQAGWNRWERTAEPGEHLLYWESLTAAELDQRFAYLDKCGWDLLHVCQHWGIWERLDAGGRIAPHGAEQISLYLRTAARHHLAVIQALTHYEYLAATRAGHGTVPFSTYLDAGMQTDDFFSPGRNPEFEKLFRRYLLDYVTLFRNETALFAMTASGEGDATIGSARAHDVFDFVRAHDTNHLFLGEPTLILRQSPRKYTEGWRQDLFGGRTYAIADQFLPEYDLGVEMKLYQLGGLALAEGSWSTSGLYAGFHHNVLGDSAWAAGSWTGTDRYRLRLRDSLYLGLVHRLPMMMTWDEQIAENEHRFIREIRRQVKWDQPFESPRIALRLASDDLDADHRRVLVQYEEALNRMRLSYLLLYPDAPVPERVEAVFDAGAPFVSPAYVSAGGSLPDRLKSSIPIEASPGFALSYSISQDRATLLAYVCNNGEHSELRSPLAGRFHRRPKPATLRLAFPNMAPKPLQLQVYDLQQQKLIRRTGLAGSGSLDLKETGADYFILITPR